MSPTGGDILFPFPEPTFLFIHTLNLYTGMSNNTVDDRGLVVKSVAGKVPTVVMGYLTKLDEHVEQNVGTTREFYDAVALVSNSVEVKIQDVIECHDPSLHSHLSGTYRVDQVRPNISHTRVLLSRIADPWKDI